MKSRKLFKKALTKSTPFIILGATVVGFGAQTPVFAKEVPTTGKIVTTTCKPSGTTTGNCIISSKPVCSIVGSGNLIDVIIGSCNPGTSNPGTNKPDTDKPNTETPDTNNPGTETPDTETPDTNNPGTETPGTSAQTTFENRVLELVNVERQKAGLKPLEMDESVRQVARLKSQDMRKNNYFDHTSPTYGSPFDMLKQFGISYKSAGENIAQGYTTPEAVVQGWMNSQGHRANILNSSFTHIGIGYDSNGHYWTQMFIGK